MRWILAPALVFLLAEGCASAPPPKPPPPDPAAEVVAELAHSLQLDAAQQKRTRELLKEMADRDDAIHAGWAGGKKVRAEEILASHGQFERQFFMLLTTEQQKKFIETRARMSVRAH